MVHYLALIAPLDPRRVSPLGKDPVCQMTSPAVVACQKCPQIHTELTGRLLYVSFNRDILIFLPAFILY